MLDDEKSESFLRRVKEDEIAKKVLFKIKDFGGKARPVEIARSFDSRFAKVAYSRLRWLEMSGLVEATTRGKRFSVYELTQRGREFLSELLSETDSSSVRGLIPNLTDEYGFKSEEIELPSKDAEPVVALALVIEKGDKVKLLRRTSVICRVSEAKNLFSEDIVKRINAELEKIE